ncbi:MAG: alpha/beta hydrolase [Acidimicrobiia bacterium]
MPVAPELQPYVDGVNGADLRPIFESPIEQVRDQSALFAHMGAKDAEPVEVVEDRTLPGPAGDIPVRVYDPDPGATSPVVAYFHGGGFVMMDLDTHDRVCRRLANAANAVVVSVDYRLAPEHRFPAALDDCMAVIHWLTVHAAELAGDPARIAVTGDSAGGNLAAATALAARNGGPGLAAQVLIYPVIDAACDTDSFATNAEGYLLTADTMRWFWDLYLGPDGDRDDPYASVMRVDDLSTAPPALVITAEYDVLRDEGEAYAERLRAAGVEVITSRYAGMIHGFLAMDDMTSAAGAAIREAAAFLQACFDVTE